MTVSNFVLLVLGVVLGVSFCMLVLIRGLAQQAKRNLQILEEIERLYKERQQKD